MSTELERIEDYQGEVDTTQLIPQMGTSYGHHKELKEIVSLLAHWQYRTALNQLDEQIENNTEAVEALLLKGELLGIWECNESAAAVYRTILEQDPENPYALVQLLIQLKILKALESECTACFEQLASVAPELCQKVKEVFNMIEQHASQYNFPPIDGPLDVICVFGYFMNDDGTMPLVLENRLLSVLELVREHPEALVLVSGGAVRNQYSEAVAMKNYLVESGMKEEQIVALEQAKDSVGNVLEFMDYLKTGTYHRICAVTTISHLPRAWMSLKVGLQRAGVNAQLFGYALEETVQPEMQELEERLNYQTVMRLAGLFEKQDIAAFLSAVSLESERLE
ncbi:YdcF family protein [Jeotgalibaca caeni]|uniref:YdcF family protein n=1 Tax=Jeotgalibaca caeni TaxID=3028623 RepID=UPI00237E2A2C|nr:ElyC/SanA/YdcF family protein [Jeotgalibaca caeni]MDE1549195.1 ElyC/SanA/YdcF family protein [Jeotgalibaca caeni]